MPKIFVKKIFRIFSGIILLITILALSINFYVKSSTDSAIYTAETVPNGDYDCILILGCGVLANGEPTAMLTDRLLCGIDLYQRGLAPKIIVSGDHGTIDYDEVNTMKNFCIAHDIPDSDIFMDHAGFSTYESLYRARDIFQADNIIIVSQNYHLYRAVYLAQALKLDAIGVGSDLRNYRGQSYREFREILARNKDFVYAIFQPLPTFLGDAIPVNGDGNLTND